MPNPKKKSAAENKDNSNRAFWEEMKKRHPHGFVEVQDEEDDWLDEDDFDSHDHDPQNDLDAADLMIQQNTQFPTAVDSDVEPEGDFMDEVWQAIADAHGERMAG